MLQDIYTHCPEKESPTSDEIYMCGSMLAKGVGDL
jgi:hypothetical protein